MPESLRRTFRSLGTRNYRLFFFGELVSHAGGWMHTMAEAWLVFSLTDSGTAVGATFAFRFAPVFLLALWGGAIADRYDRRRLLLLTQVAQAALAALLWLLVETGTVEVWMVFVLAAVLGVVTAIEQPTHHAFVEEMVGPEQLGNAVALNSAVMNSARITGPALAALVIAAAGTSWVFFANAVSFLAVVAALAAMNTSELRPPRRSSSVRIREGLAHAWAVAELRSTVLLVGVVGTLVYNFPTFLTILARDTFDGGAGVAGLLMAVLGAGTLLGALLAAGLVRQTARTVIGGAAGLGAALVIVALLPRGLVIVALVPVGVFATFFGATASAHMQLCSAQHFRGRVMAVYTTLTLGATIVGGPLMGAVAERWGARTGLATAGVATAITACALTLVRRRERVFDVDARTHVEAAQVAAEATT